MPPHLPKKKKGVGGGEGGRGCTGYTEKWPEMDIFPNKTYISYLNVIWSTNFYSFFFGP